MCTKIALMVLVVLALLCLRKAAQSRAAMWDAMGAALETTVRINSGHTGHVLRTAMQDKYGAARGCRIVANVALACAWGVGLALVWGLINAY